MFVNLQKNKTTASTSSLLKWQDKLPSSKLSPRESTTTQEVTQFQLMEVAVQLSGKQYNLYAL